MWHISLPWWEFVVRAFIVYIFIVIALRLKGKRQVGQFSPFDFVMLLILSNAVQNSMNGGDNSITGGLILAAVLIALNWVLDYMIFRIPKLQDIMEGKPEILVFNGKIYKDILEKEKISMDELMSAIRRNGILDVKDAHYVMLESNGSVSVIPKRRE